VTEDRQTDRKTGRRRITPFFIAGSEMKTDGLLLVFVLSGFRQDKTIKCFDYYFANA